MNSIITTFHIEWKTIVAELINFGVVFVVLYIFALKPLQKLMAERSDRIAKGLHDAKENAATLEMSRKEREEILAEARKEAQKFFEAGKKDTEIKKTEMMEGAKQEVAKMLESGKKSLEMEKVKMVADAKREVVSLAVAAAEKILLEKSGSGNDKAVKDLHNLK